MLDPLRIDPRLTIPASELSWTAVRSSGPGGQNVNKVASKVELRFMLAQSAVLSPTVKARLRARAGKRVNAQGELCLVSQRTRDQKKNLDDALEKLRELVLAALETPKVRRPTRPTRASKTRRMEQKHLQASKKRLRARVGTED
jgi:ribosome-associated protein